MRAVIFLIGLVSVGISGPAIAEFKLDVSPSEVAKDLAIYRVGDLVVGDTGYITNWAWCAKNGQLFLPGTKLLTDLSEWGSRWKISILPGRAVSLEMNHGDKVDADERREALNKHVYTLAASPSCELRKILAPAGESENLLRVETVVGRKSLSEYLAWNTSSRNEPDKNSTSEFAEKLRKSLIGAKGSKSDKTKIETSWYTSTNTDPIDDSPEILISRSSENRITGTFGAGNRATLYLRCAKNTTNLILQVGEYLGSEDTVSVTYRLDDYPPSESAWRVSTTNRSVGLWGGTDSIPVIRKMLAAEKMVFRMRPPRKSQITMTFRLNGLDKAIGPLASACTWTP